MADNETTVIPEPIENPVPEKTPYAVELEQALADSGIKTKVPNDAKKVTKEPKVEEPRPEESKPEVKEPVTQEKLSSGFAKLARQQRAAERKERELAEREKHIESLKADFEKSSTERSTALESRAAEVDKLLKLFDEDEEACLEALASRRKTTTDAFYDKLTRRRLNGGVRAPEDQVAEVRSEVEALKREKAARDAADKEAAEKAAKEKADSEMRAAIEHRIQQENAGFVAYCKSDDGATKRYPLLSEEPDEDIVGTARNLIAGATAQGKNVSFTEVADYLEHLLSLNKLKEDAAAKAAEAETPKKSAPKVEGKKPEPAKAKTITNSMHGPRSVKSESTPRDDNERLERALAQWK